MPDNKRNSPRSAQGLSELILDTTVKSHTIDRLTALHALDQQRAISCRDFSIIDLGFDSYLRRLELVRIEIIIKLNLKGAERGAL